MELDCGKRTLRGTLVGVKQGDLDVIEMDSGEFFSSIKIENRGDKLQWEVINMYGPVQLKTKAAFLQELSQNITEMECPFLIGG